MENEIGRAVIRTIKKMVTQSRWRGTTPPKAAAHIGQAAKRAKMGRKPQKQTACLLCVPGTTRAPRPAANESAELSCMRRVVMFVPKLAHLPLMLAIGIGLW